jgi:hypothetical protein
MRSKLSTILIYLKSTESKQKNTKNLLKLVTHALFISQFLDPENEVGYEQLCDERMRLMEFWLSMSKQISIDQMTEQFDQ